MYPKSIILDSSNNVIGAIDKDSKYFVFKLGFSSTKTSFAYEGDNSNKEDNAFAIISDGGAGYYATGYVEQASIAKTGL